MEDISIAHSTECFRVIDNTFGPLNIVRHKINNVPHIILWNEFSILVKHESSFNSTSCVNYTGFSIKQAYFQENIILCVDEDHSLHFGIFKNTEYNVECLEFKQILKNVLFVFNNGSDIGVLLNKDNELRIYNYKLLSTSKMKLSNVYILYTNIFVRDLYKTEIVLDIMCLKHFPIDFIQNIFNVELSKITLEQSVLFLAVENILYWAILKEGPNEKNVWNIFYSCAGNIKQFNIIKDNDIRFSLSLETGSVIVLSFDILDKHLLANIFHLNSSLEKIIFWNSGIIYSDDEKIYCGILNSKHDENTFVLQQTLNIVSPNHFLFDSESCCVYATSHHNMVYKVTLNKKTDNKYQDTISIPRNFSPTKHVMSDIEEEIKANKEILRSLNSENDYITILYMNLKKKLLKNYLETLFNVCKLNYNLDYSSTPPTLADTVCESPINIVEIKMDTSLQTKMELIMKNIPDIFFINIQLTSNDYLSSYNGSALLNDTPVTTLYLPFNVKPPLTVHTNIVSLIPGVHQSNHKFWTILNGNKVIGNSAYFYTLTEFVNNTTELNSYENQLTSIVNRNCKLLFDISKCNATSDEPLTLYIRLPASFIRDSKKFAELFVSHLPPSKAEVIKGKLGDANFLCGRQTISLEVVDRTIELGIKKTSSQELTMEVKSRHIDTCLDVFTCIIGIIRTMDSSMEGQFILNFDLIILKNIMEDMEKAMRSMQKKTLSQYLNILYKNAIGILPV